MIAAKERVHVLERCSVGPAEIGCRHGYIDDEMRSHEVPEVDDSADRPGSSASTSTLPQFRSLNITCERHGRRRGSTTSTNRSSRAEQVRRSAVSGM